jgi:hypothetical protein
MRLRIKKPQLHASPLKHLRVMPFLMLDERFAARVNRDRYHLRLRLAQGVDDVTVLLAKGMPKDAQPVAMAQ